jgi:hypothetical protein
MVFFKLYRKVDPGLDSSMTDVRRSGADPAFDQGEGARLGVAPLQMARFFLVQYIGFNF